LYFNLILKLQIVLNIYKYLKINIIHKCYENVKLILNFISILDILYNIDNQFIKCQKAIQSGKANKQTM
jgi:hypothetical protein